MTFTRICQLGMRACPDSRDLLRVVHLVAGDKNLSTLYESMGDWRLDVCCCGCCRCCWLCLDLPTLSDCMEDETCYWWLMSSAWLISWCDFTALYLCLAYKYLCPLHYYTSFLFNIYVLFVCCPVHTLFCPSCSVLFIFCSVPVALSCSYFVLFHLLCPFHTLFCSSCSVLFTLCSVPLALSCSYFVLFQLLFCLYFVLFHLLRIVVCSTSVLTVCLPGFYFVLFHLLRIVVCSMSVLTVWLPCLYFVLFQLLCPCLHFVLFQLLRTVVCSMNVITLWLPDTHRARDVEALPVPVMSVLPCSRPLEVWT